MTSKQYEELYNDCLKGYAKIFLGSQTNRNLARLLFEWVEIGSNVKRLRYKSLHHKDINYAPNIHSFSDYISFYCRGGHTEYFEHPCIGCSAINFPNSGKITFLCNASLGLSKKKYIPEDYEFILEYDFSEKAKLEAEEDYKNILLKEKAQRLKAEKDEIRYQILEKERKRNLRDEVLQDLINEDLIFKESAKRPLIPIDIINTIWNRDKGQCVYCGSTQELQFDHIIPFSKGGATSVENLQLLCRECNREKSNKIG